MGAAPASLAQLSLGTSTAHPRRMPRHPRCYCYLPPTGPEITFAHAATPHAPAVPWHSCTPTSLAAASRAKPRATVTTSSSVGRF